MKRTRILLVTAALLLAVMLPTSFASAATVVVDTTVYKSGVLRAEPDLDADVVDYICNGTSIIILSTQGNWYAVETADGQKGYMHKSIVSEADASTDTVAIKQAANVRAAESSDSEYVRGLDEGAEVLLVERGRSWSKIIIGNKTGYIHNTVLDYAAE